MLRMSTVELAVGNLGFRERAAPAELEVSKSELRGRAAVWNWRPVEVDRANNVEGEVRRSCFGDGDPVATSS